MRDRRTLLILLFVPAFFLLLYGYALNFDIRHMRLAVQDDDRTRREPRADLGVRELRLLRSRRRRARRRARVDRLLDADDARAVLVIPAGFGATRDRAAGAGAGAHQRRQRQYRDDGHGLRDGLVSAESARYELQARIGRSPGRC